MFDNIQISFTAKSKDGAILCDGGVVPCMLPSPGWPMGVTERKTRNRKMLGSDKHVLPLLNQLGSTLVHEVCKVAQIACGDKHVLAFPNQLGSSPAHEMGKVAQTAFGFLQISCCEY